MNVSVAVKNGYRMDKVLKAKEYLKEIGQNRRTFDIERLVEMYNDIKGTHEKAQGCKPCAANKYYNGIENYYRYGKLTLITNGLAVEEDFEDKVVEEQPKEVENAENRLVGVEEEVKEEVVEEVKEEEPKKTKRSKKQSE